MVTGTRTINEDSIGTASRDWSTVASYEGALPADFTPGNDSKLEMGTMFADSVFTEGDTIFTGIPGGSTIAHVILRAAVGQEWSLKNGEAGKVHWKPAAGNFRAMQASAGATLSTVELYGIEFDNTDADGFATAGIVDIKTQLIAVSRCSFHNNALGYGLNFSTTTIGKRKIANCIFSENAKHGFFREIDTSTRGMDFEFCGFYNNTLFGATGPSAGSTLRFDYRECWFYRNGSGSIDDGGGGNISGWCVFEDAPVTPLTPVWTDVLESQLESAANFVDAPNGNFKIQAGSNLLGIGRTRSILTSFRFTDHVEDAAGTHLVFTGAASRYDIGPHQFSFTAAPVVSLVPVIAFVSRTATTITINITNTGGKTAEVFTWLPGATVGISQGTRVGNGNFTADPLVEGIAYRFTAAVQD